MADDVTFDVIADGDARCRHCAHMRRSVGKSLSYPCSYWGARLTQPGGRFRVMPDEPACKEGFNPRCRVRVASILWRDGLSVAEISEATGLAKGTIYKLTLSSPGDFPPRRFRVKERRRAAAVALVKSGDLSARAAASLLGVDHTTVSRWVRKEREAS